MAGAQKLIPSFELALLSKHFLRKPPALYADQDFLNLRAIRQVKVIVWKMLRDETDDIERFNL